MVGSGTCRAGQTDSRHSRAGASVGLVESTHGELQRRVNRIGTKQAGVGTALAWKKEGGRRVPDFRQ